MPPYYDIPLPDFPGMGREIARGVAALGQPNQRRVQVEAARRRAPAVDDVEIATPEPGPEAAAVEEATLWADGPTVSEAAAVADPRLFQRTIQQGRRRAIEANPEAATALEPEAPEPELLTDATDRPPGTGSADLRGSELAAYRQAMSLGPEGELPESLQERQFGPGHPAYRPDYGERTLTAKRAAIDEENRGYYDRFWGQRAQEHAMARGNPSERAMAEPDQLRQIQLAGLIEGYQQSLADIEDDLEDERRRRFETGRGRTDEEMEADAARRRSNAERQALLVASILQGKKLAPDADPLLMSLMQQQGATEE